MSMIDRSLDGMAFLSGQLGAILRRRLREVGGIALISLAMMAALALATWSVRDPSLSHATDAAVHNLLGRPGAIVADLSGCSAPPLRPRSRHACRAAAIGRCRPGLAA
jgi:S-DNA-T family DNA segregation ATPase FtsK/SpoIIIE